MRSSYQESVDILRDRAGSEGDPLAALDRRPQYDDEEMGPSIFRTSVEHVELDHLTLPCLFVGRSRFLNVTFASTDLHLSTINWTDVVDCDFSDAILADADLRACKFRRCVFRGADLSAADLRGSTFERCTFEGAIMKGTQLQRTQKRFGFRIGASHESLPLSDAQRAEADWRDDSPEPAGG